MHLVFERSNGRFKSNCNILALAWTPYYAEEKFRQALYDYHQKQLLDLADSNRPANLHRENHGDTARIGYLARGHNARLQNGLRRASSVFLRDSLTSNPISDSAQHTRSTEHRPRLNQITVSHRTNRIDEFCKRCTYAPRQATCGSSSVQSPANHHGDEVEQRVDLSKTVDLNYGRMQEFGWLILGNVGKTVGVTLTATIDPPSQADEELFQSENNDDLIVFNDEDCSNPPKSKTVFSGIEFDRFRPDRIFKRSNYNLRGHLDEVILVKWNELYQKLATIDSKGNVLIWARTDEKFTIQTPFYNRSKTVADFKWSNDGKTALICYTDSFILVGSSTGQRHWHSMLNLDDYHITCASWTPNDETLLLGVSNGNVVMIDLLKSELNEVTLGTTNVRAMAWSTGDVSLKSLGSICLSNKNQSRLQKKRQARKVNSQTGPATSNNIDSSDLDNRSADTNKTKRTKTKTKFDFKYKVRNVLAIDFACNTIKLFDGGLLDLKPMSIVVDLESYTMQWSSDGSTLVVAGFNIHTSAPSAGCLKCQYLNELKFYNQDGELIYKTPLRHTRYPITAITWAHDDQRLFIATGPHIHCAKVFFGVPKLELLATSCLQKYTRLPNKVDFISRLSSGYFDDRIMSWQSESCQFNTDFHIQARGRVNTSLLGNSYSALKDSLKVSGNNSNVFQYKLPIEIQMKVDQLFSSTVRQPFDECLSMSDIIWHVPKRGKRFYCTLICYANENELASSNHQYNIDSHTNNGDDDQNLSDQHKIFILYAEFLGSMVPILRARRIGFLKPEFVIFDPEVDRSFGKKLHRHQKVSDVSHCSIAQNSFQSAATYQQDPPNSERFGPQARYLYSKPVKPSSSIGDSATNSPRLICSQLHQSVEAHKPKGHDLSNVDSQHNLSYGRSHHQEPQAFPSFLNPASQALEYARANLDPGFYMINRDSEPNYLHCSDEVKCTTYIRQDMRISNSHSNRMSNSLPESHELLRIKSNVWATRFKMLSVGNRMIRRPVVVGLVDYKASILHLQPRQILLTIRNMSNYCCLCSMHHHHQNHHLDKGQIKRSLVAARSSKVEAYKSHESKRREQSKIVLDVGDALRIAPKLENNQIYVSQANKFDDKASVHSRSELSYRFVNHQNRVDERLESYPTSKASSSTNRVGKYPVASVAETEQEDILTFTLSQGDQVRIEMSSPATKLNSKEVVAEEKLKPFLEANKALQSIRSITEKLEEMSRAASREDHNPVCTDEAICLRKSTTEDSCSSAKSPKLVDCHLVPSTPVHRPRKINGSCGSRLDSRRSLIDTARSRPPKGFGSRASSVEPTPVVELPVPPPNAPLRRRISSKAKGLLDGSLRSLYGSSFLSSTDLDSDEGELLMSRRARKRTHKRSSSIQSQPVTPIKRIANSLRNLTEINSLSNNLIERIRPGLKTARPAWDASDLGTASLEHQPQSFQSYDAPRRHRRSKERLDHSSSSESLDSRESVAFKELKRKQLRRAEKEAEMACRSSKALLDTSGTAKREKTSSGQHWSSERPSKGESKQPGSSNQSAMCDYSACQCNQHFRLRNRPPVWNDQNQVYQLDFGGRVTQESAKNLQIDFEGNLALQFGRLSRCTYTLDYRYPFNAVQAMSIALASLTQRLK